ncbi:MAG: 5-deoxy-glucuronate isomerase [Vicinamibacteraceae bacterium]
MTSETLAPTTCVVRNTAASKGRTQAVAAGPVMRHLYYGRIILDAGDAPVSFDTGERETALICLRGVATIDVGETRVTLERYDAIYAPRDASVEVSAGAGGCDLAEISAAVSGRHPVQVVRFAAVQRDPSLHVAAGGPTAKRDLNVLIGKNVQAGRIMAGVTFSEPGNWTSWPPHEHAVMLEEAYLYIDMPAPAFGVQLLYTEAREPEVATIVREGDIVLMPKGYHPNVAAPGGSINFLWMMAAHTENTDRQYGVVNVHPDFAATPSGLDAAKATR